jgi:hypothetical protein
MEASYQEEVMWFVTSFERTTLVSCLTLLALGCSSTSYTREGLEAPSPPPQSPCQVAVLQHVPRDDTFTELGQCSVSIYGGGILFDNSSTAIKKLQECACEHGGNAIVLLDNFQAGANTMMKYAERRIGARASVLLVSSEELK